MFIRKGLHKMYKVLHLNQHLRFRFSTNTNYNNIDPKVDYYSLLQINKNASPQQIQKAYYRLAHIYSPDMQEKSNSKLNQVTRAYQILSDEKLRRQYHYQRFLHNLDQKMQENFNSNKQSQKQENSSDLSPQQQNVAEKMNKFIKISLMITVGLLIFGPFIFWKGQARSPAEQIAEGGYPRRHGGMHLNRHGPREQYMEGNGGRISRQDQIQQNIARMNPPGYIVTGKIVYD